MTVTGTTTRNAYTGNGTTTVFAYGFQIKTSADIKVYDNGTLKTLTTHYTLSGVGDLGGGNVTFLTAPANGNNVMLVRDSGLLQATDFVDNDKFPAASLKNAVDRLTLMEQEYRNNRVLGSITVGEGNTTGTLAVSQEDTNYKVFVQPATITGSVAAGSWTVKSVAKTRTLVTITVEVAPGAGTSVAFDVMVVR